MWPSLSGWPSLGSAQSLLAVAASAAGLATLGWRLFGLLNRAWDRKNLLEMLDAETQRASYWKAQAEECRTERDHLR